MATAKTAPREEPGVILTLSAHEARVLRRVLGSIGFPGKPINSMYGALASIGVKHCGPTFIFNGTRGADFSNEFLSHMNEED